MSRLLRYYSNGYLYFVTTVTHGRKPILVEKGWLLRHAITRAEKRLGCMAIAWVILPDHLHLLIETPDQRLSEIMHHIKLTFSARYREYHNIVRGHIWQSRFWDHLIRNETDLAKHVDYIHINPVKHGYVSKPEEWEYSTFRTYLESGYYQADWGDNILTVEKNQFGE